MCLFTTYMNKLKVMYNANQLKGFIPTNIEGVYFFCVEESKDKSLIIYEPGMVIIAQGYKVAYLNNNKVLRYDKDNYLLVSKLAVPFECSIHATRQEPVLGLFISFDLSELHELIDLIVKYGLPKHFNESSVKFEIDTIAMDKEIRDCINRLTKVMCSRLDSKILGKSVVREILYSVLVSDYGAALYSLTQDNTNYNRIIKILTYMRKNYSKHINIDDLANKIGMSISVFHRYFKDITGTSPLQYLKKMRLNKARNLILYEGLRPSNVAIHVGYQSIPQFNREFKNYFGYSPREAKNILNNNERKIKER